MRRSWVHSFVCAWTTWAVLLGGCRTPAQVVQAPKPVPAVLPAAPPVVAQPEGRPRVPITNPDEDHGQLVLTLGDTGVSRTDATVSTLTPAETQALLARLEPLPVVNNAGAPVIRPASAPPPRSGVTSPIEFVAQTGKILADKPVSDAPAGVPVLVAPQILPVGDVRAESEIRVRFDEPMVPVAAIGETKTAPATITPAVAGTWRWIDTRVATFTANGPRLAMATTYTVTVPAGTKAVSGATLGEAVSGQFSTPPVSIVGTYPTVKLRPDSPLLVRFDQAVDPAAIVKFLRVEDGRKRSLAFDAISLDEARIRWKRNPAVAADKSDIGAHYVVLAPRTAWPAGISGRVVLAKNAPSTEGPRLSTELTGASFDVAGPFVVDGLSCDNMERPRRTNVRCAADGYVNVELSNAILQSEYRSKQIQIEGQPFHDHTPSGSTVTLDTPLSVGTTHTIRISPSIRDIYGQPYVGVTSLSFQTTAVRLDPYLSARGGLYVLDPRFEIPQWVVNVQSVSALKVELYQVGVNDYFAYEDFESGKRKTPPGKRVYVKDHAIGARAGGIARVDLRPALTNGLGHVIAVATATPAAGVAKMPAEYARSVAWIQVSRLGLSARVDGERVHAWLHDITPGTRFLQPLPNVMTQLIVEDRTDAPAPVATDASGHAVSELLSRVDPKPETYEYPTSLLVAKSGDDSVFTATGGRFEKAIRTREALWYVTDDRFTYKPNETVYVKGWVRWTENGVNPQLDLPGSGDALTWSLVDAQGNRVANGTASFTAQGGFDFEAKLPPNVNLGSARFDLKTRGQEISHRISIEEFRTPAFSVTLADDVQFSGARPLIVGESITMTGEARYYAGGGLAGAGVGWHAELTSASYQPPGWDRYTFSTPLPRGERFSRWSDRVSTDADVSATLSSGSSSTLQLGIAALPRHAPSILSVDASVTDIDRQTIRASSREILVHPASLYVGIRKKPDAQRTLQIIVTDIDGNVVTGVPVTLTLEGVLWSERDRADAEIADTQTCKVTSGASPVECPYTRKNDDIQYVATARIVDPQGRENAAQYIVPWWSYADDDLSVKPDKQLYRPGDVAKLEISSKRTPAIAIVSFARNGVISQKRVSIDSPTTVELPIEPAFIDNVHVIVDRITTRRHQELPERGLLGEDDYRFVDLAVDRESARLSMRTRPLQPLVEPGENATFEVEVKHEDKPVQGAEVALVVVDEAVLAISGKTHKDPLEPFYRHVGDGTSYLGTIDMVQDAGGELKGVPGFERWKIDELGRGGFGTGYGYGSGSGSMRGRSASVKGVVLGSVVQSRKDFRATAVFSPRLATDATGKVRVTVKMPDSLTRYRIVALATANTRYFGKAESNIVAQRKVNARTVPPRFLTQGDTFSLPVVVQNLDERARTIDVAVRAANLASTGPQGKRVTVPAGQRAEVRFDFATQTRGKAVVQTIAVSDGAADASNVEIPVYEPATTESFATYGTVDDKPHFEQLKVPADVFPEVGGIEAEVSSTQLQNLTDSFWYLYAYPFECAEQRSARMLATSAMYDILEAFATGTRPSKQELAATREYDRKRLTRDQNSDGGWGYFRGMDSDPFVTMQVFTALAAQHEVGPVMKNAVDYITRRATTLLAGVEAQVKARDVKLQHRADDAANISLAATALSALSAAGIDVVARAVRLHTTALALGTYPVDAKARILAMLAGNKKQTKVREKLLADLLSAVHETASSATVTASFTEAERMLLVSNNKTTALALDAILREQPQHALVTKLARGLLDARKRGRWVSTQENVIVLAAMRRYFDVYEKDTPNFTGKLWLGAAAYAEQPFVGRSTVRAVTHADWSMLAPGTTHDIAIERAGTAGRLYYRLGITYAPKATNLPPLDAGFIVRRTYKAVDDPGDVVKLPDGRYKVKLGARVLVQLEALNTSYRHAVALVDPLPAGFEAVNERLATAERAVVDTAADRWDHTEMRDNRSEAFSMDLHEGTHRFSYTARATIPGTFVTAPAKAEEMYSPETFGRSAGTTVIVE